MQLLRSYKTHEKNKRKIGQERSSMQQADYQCHRPTPWMQESVSMHKSPAPVRHSRMNQARSEKEKKRGRETGKTEARRLMERKAAQQRFSIEIPFLFHGYIEGNNLGNWTVNRSMYTLIKSNSIAKISKPWVIWRFDGTQKRYPDCLCRKCLLSNKLDGGTVH